MNNYFSVEEKHVEMSIDQKVNLETMLSFMEKRREDDLRFLFNYFHNLVY